MGFLLSRRRLAFGLFAGLLLVAVAPAIAGSGNLKLAMKSDSQGRVHASLSVTMNYAGLSVVNKPLFSFDVPPAGKFVGRKLNLPGGSIEGKIAQKGNRIDLRFRALAATGAVLNKTFELAKYNGTKTFALF